MLRLELSGCVRDGIPWVARIKGFGGQPYFDRVFISPAVTFSPGPCVPDTRTFFLDEGPCYESFEPGYGRGFFYVEKGEIIPLTGVQLKKRLQAA